MTNRIEKNQSGAEGNKFWTAGRAAFAAAAFLAAAVGFSNCTADDTSRDAASNAARPEGAGKPTVTVTSRPAAQPPRPASDTLAASVMNAEIQALDGGAFTLADYKDKIVVLNLWATWCPPCRKETPHIIDIQKEYGGRGVAVVGLTTENPATDGQKVRDFVRDFGVNYKIGYARADLALELMRGNTSIPQTFVIVPGGRVVAHYRGYSPQLPDMLRAALDKAQSEVSQK